MKTMANEIKVVIFGGKEIERQITLNLVRRIAGGMEAAGDVFAPSGVKTGFYRYQSRYEYPIFFSVSGRRLYGDNPINRAIKEVVHNWAASINSKRREVKEAAAATKNEAYQAVRAEALAVLAANKERSAKKVTAQNINELSKEGLIELGFNARQADAIIERRQHGDINNVSELLDVKGVGQKTLDKVLTKLKDVNAA